MPKKRNAKRLLRPVFYIFCEGEKTEPYYIDHYVKKHCAGYRSIQVRRIKLDEVVKWPKTGRTDPISLVKLALKQKEMSPSLGEDQFWCVYDREAEDSVPAKLHIQAFEVAEAKGIHVAFSNICFEVWLLLHKQDGCAAYNSCADLLKRSKMRSYFDGYKKGCRREFSDAEISNARHRVLRMNANTCNVPIKKFTDVTDPRQLVKLNPYTNFHRLLDAIDDFLANLV